VSWTSQKTAPAANRNGSHRMDPEVGGLGGGDGLKIFAQIS